MEHGASSYRRFLDGDEAAFSEILREYRDPLTFFIQRYVHDLGAAEDIAIDVFMDLIVHPRRYHFNGSFKTYLFMRARSCAIDYIRHRNRRPAVPIEEAEALPADDSTPEEQVLRDARSRMLHEAIAQLPEDQQIAVHLVYFEERSYADTARIMKKSAKQVDNLLYRAKKSLRSIIGEEGDLSL